MTHLLRGRENANAQPADTKEKYVSLFETCFSMKGGRMTDSKRSLSDFDFHLICPHRKTSCSDHGEFASWRPCCRVLHQKQFWIYQMARQARAPVQAGQHGSDSDGSVAEPFPRPHRPLRWRRLRPQQQRRRGARRLHVPAHPATGAPRLRALTPLKGPAPRRRRGPPPAARTSTAIAPPRRCRPC